MRKLTRSEKEIKEKEFKDFYSDSQHRAIGKTICWVLAGEKRYSIKELKKILESLEFDEWFSEEYEQSSVNSDPEDLLEWIKENPKKVKEILEEKPSKSRQETGD